MSIVSIFVTISKTTGDIHHNISYVEVKNVKIYVLYLLIEFSIERNSWTSTGGRVTILKFSRVNLCIKCEYANF